MFLFLPERQINCAYISSHPALVGANKGIGFEIVKKIARAPNWKCFLTARDEVMNGSSHI